MISFVCDLLGLTFSTLSDPLKIVVVVCSCALVCFFCDTIVRLVIAPLIRLMGGK